MAVITSDLRALLDPREIVLRFLESIGRRSEAEFYLTLFTQQVQAQFATLVVDAPVIADAVDAVGLDLRFLASLGLTPVVCIGLFDGASAPEQARKLKNVLVHMGLTADVLPSTQVDGVVACVRRQCVPIVLLTQPPSATVASAVAPGAGVREVALESLVTALGSRKLLFLQRRGGLRRQGKAVPQMLISASLVALTQTFALSDKQRSIVAIAQRLLLPSRAGALTVSITSPLQLLRELFTVKGAGTLLRCGAPIRRVAHFAALDAARLAELLHSAFGRPVNQAFFATVPQAIYIDDDYQAAAVTIRTPLGIYLSKFAVGRKAQGEGLGGDLWQHVVRDNPVLFWRSRRDNPIDPWYVRQCDTMIRRPRWHVFMRGLAPEQLAAAVAYAEQAPVDWGQTP